MFSGFVFGTLSLSGKRSSQQFSCTKPADKAKFPEVGTDESRDVFRALAFPTDASHVQSVDRRGGKKATKVFKIGR